MMRVAVASVVLAVLAACTGRAFAAVQPPDPPAVSVWSIQPPNPTTADAVYVRNVFTGCDNGAFRSTSTIRLDPQSRTVTVELWGSDVCDDYVTEQVTDAFVGYLPAGNWILTWVGCNGAEPDPEQACSSYGQTTMGFVVTEATRPKVIPASSTASSFALAGMLAVIALWMIRLRR